MAANWTGYEIKPSGYSYKDGTSGNPQFGNKPLSGTEEMFKDSSIGADFMTVKPEWMTEEEWQAYKRKMMGGDPAQNYGIGGSLYGNAYQPGGDGKTFNQGSGGYNRDYDYSSGIGGSLYDNANTLGYAPRQGIAPSFDYIGGMK